MIPLPVLVFAQTDPAADDTIGQLGRLSAADWIVAASIIVGAVVFGLILRIVTSRLLTERSGPLVAQLVSRLVFALLLAIGIVYALNFAGVSIGPLLGLLGLLGLAFALAFQEVLGNFIAGIMLSLQRPFRIGDEIRTAGYDGTVEEVSLRSTTIRTFDGVQVFVPNSTVWEEPIENHTTLGARRTTIEMGVGYDSDLDAVQANLLETMEAIEGIKAEPRPQAYVYEFGENSINFAVRFWHDSQISTEWEVRDLLARRMKEELDRTGIDIPFPQMVLHMVSGSSQDSIQESPTT